MCNVTELERCLYAWKYSIYHMYTYVVKAYIYVNNIYTYICFKNMYIYRYNIYICMCVIKAYIYT